MIVSNDRNSFLFGVGMAPPQPPVLRFDRLVKRMLEEVSVTEKCLPDTRRRSSWRTRSGYSGRPFRGLVGWLVVSIVVGLTLVAFEGRFPGVYPRFLTAPSVPVMKKGQVMSPYFRILNKGGGFTWMQICATIICSSKNGEEQNIICVNYVLR